MIDKLKKSLIEILERQNEISDEFVANQIDGLIDEIMPYEPIENKLETSRRLFNEFCRYGKLQPLLEDDHITEIMVNHYQEILIEKGGKIERSDIRFDDEEELFRLIQKIVGKMDRKVNERHPVCDVRMKDGSRVNIVLSPISLNGHMMTIRKFPKCYLDKKDLIKNRTVSQEAMACLELLVVKKYNLFISGGTSAGKTTLLNVLSHAIPNDERIVTIEDSAELKLSKASNIVSLEARDRKDEFNHVISIKDLIKTSLRMRPDRIIVGEIRGDEAIDMLQSMNTGHDGSICTGHANSANDSIFRIETMVLTGVEIPLPAIRQQIASALDFIVHVQKIKGRGRRITEIAEISGIENGFIKLNPLYQYNKERDQLEKTGKEIIYREKLLWN